MTFGVQHRYHKAVSSVSSRITIISDDTCYFHNPTLFQYASFDFIFQNIYGEIYEEHLIQSLPNLQSYKISTSEPFLLAGIAYGPVPQMQCALFKTFFVFKIKMISSLLLSYLYTLSLITLPSITQMTEILSCHLHSQFTLTNSIYSYPKDNQNQHCFGFCIYVLIKKIFFGC